MTEFHCADELLEYYSLNRLPDELVARVEEHLLTCEACRIRLVEADRFVAAGLAAAAEMKRDEERKKLRKGRLLFGAWMPAPIWAGAAAAIVIALLIPVFRSNNSEPLGVSDVTLTASRGAEESLIAHARPGSLILHMNARELPADRGYRLRLVDADGNEIWSGPAYRSRGELKVAVPKAVRNGKYWVRIFGDEDTRLLREYGLVVN